MLQKNSEQKTDESVFQANETQKIIESLDEKENKCTNVVQMTSNIDNVMTADNS